MISYNYTQDVIIMSATWMPCAIISDYTSIPKHLADRLTARVPECPMRYEEM